MAEQVEDYADLWQSPPPANLFLLRSPDGFLQPVYKIRGSSQVVLIDDRDVRDEVARRMREAGVPETDDA